MKKEICAADGCLKALGRDTVVINGKKYHFDCGQRIRGRKKRVEMGESTLMYHDNSKRFKPLVTR
jgi:hypothetical protein